MPSLEHANQYYRDLKFPSGGTTIPMYYFLGPMGHHIKILMQIASKIITQNKKSIEALIHDNNSILWQ